MKRTLQKDGRTLAYHIHGEGSEDLVLVHGWMVSGAVFNRLLPLLDTRFRVIIPDHRGAGHSASCDTYHLEDYVADLDAAETARLRRSVSRILSKNVRSIEEVMTEVMDVIGLGSTSTKVRI